MIFDAMSVKTKKYLNLYKNFRGFGGSIVNLMENNEEELENLTKKIEQEKRTF